ncbi:cuticle protein 19-like [Agrilus planipennis]|uniref:Cuticle protein 19-like n=1 Tax=Agrilus planipennis TaxID=224129 RepID=A0A1W4WPA5_AGRPL|nr:cuticle protein 19-like [Agrilus planipennis]
MRFPPALLINLVTTLITTLIIHSRAVLAAYNEAKYSFKYAVEAPTYNVVNHHWEERHGNHVRGGYGLLDPDGRVRVVEYQVDGQKGFQAVVRYRPPPAPLIRGHLRFPWEYQKPVWFAKPVSLITSDLFKSSLPYPYFRN